MATLKLQKWFDKKDYGHGLALLAQLSKNRILYQNLSRKKNPEKLEYELKKIAEREGIVFGKIEETTGGEQTEPVIPDTNPEILDNTPENSNDNSEKQDKIKDDAEEVVKEKLEDLQDAAEDIVSESIDNIQAGADEVVAGTQNELELMADQVITGKLKIVREGKEISFNDLSPEMKARWEQNRDAYKEIRVLHEKLKLMENATPEDRQPLTQRICDLDDKIRENWKEIDAFVPGSSNNEPTEAIDHKRIQANRKYISSNLKKLPEIEDSVKKAKIVTELQLRYHELKLAGETVAQETLDELKKVGVKC